MAVACILRLLWLASSSATHFLACSSSLRHTSTMSYLPKTPSHRHRSRSETKTPLTPSLASGINALSLGIPRQGSRSPTKGKADVSFNPFLSSRPSSPVRRAQSTSRPASPIKRATTGSLQVSDTLQRQASSGIIRKGGVESRIDVITRDYVPPKTQKRSRSQPNVSSAFIAGSFHLHCKLLRGGHRRVRRQGVRKGRCARGTIEGPTGTWEKEKEVGRMRRVRILIQDRARGRRGRVTAPISDAPSSLLGTAGRVGRTRTSIRGETRGDRAITHHTCAARREGVDEGGDARVLVARFRS